MQQLVDSIKTPARQAASSLLEVFPLSHALSVGNPLPLPPGLSVPQFRTLAFVQHHTHASLSEVAEHIGLTLPTMSKLIDTLVERELILRHVHSLDRRRMSLALTPGGSAMLARAQAKAENALSAQLSTLTDHEQRTIIEALADSAAGFFSREKRQRLCNE